MSVALVVSAIAAAFFQNYWLTLPLGLGSCYYGLSFFCYDLDSKEVRSKVQENILKWSFVDLTANFTFEDMLQYDLLKKFTEFYTTYQKVQIYAHIKDLIDFRKKTLIDIQQKHAEFLLRHPQHPVENSTNIHSAYILRSTYKEKMDLVIEERYRKILEGAFLKEDLQ